MGMWHDEVQRNYRDTDKILMYFHVFIVFFVLVFLHDSAGFSKSVAMLA
jgi:hypothetical protein